jgi:hypothetical protein
VHMDVHGNLEVGYERTVDARGTCQQAQGGCWNSEKDHHAVLELSICKILVSGYGTQRVWRVRPKRMKRNERSMFTDII